MRRQLAERPQLAGVTLRPVVEVEDLEAAVQLTARGIGETVVARAVLRHGARCPVAAGGAVRRPAVGDLRVHRPARLRRCLPRPGRSSQRVERRLERLGELILYQGATSAAGPEQFPAPAPDGLT